MLHDKISSILFVSYVTALFSGVARATCYYPDGCVSLQDTPCSDDTEHSTCCGQGYACLSNKMCMATGEELQKPGATVLVRGSCTDKDWRSSECPLFCINPATDNMPGGMGIRQCENNPEFYFCNNSQGHDCDTAENVLLFKGDITILTTIGVTPITASLSTSASTSDSASASASASESSATDPTRPSATPEKTEDGSTTEGTTEMKSKNSAVGIGVAVGLGVPGAIGAAVGLWIWSCRKRGSGEVEAAIAQLKDPGCQAPVYEVSGEQRRSELAVLPVELPAH